MNYKNLGELLDYIGGFHADAPLCIEMEGSADNSITVRTGDIKNALMSALFEIPSLRQSLDEARNCQRWEYSGVEFSIGMSHIGTYRRFSNVLQEMGRNGWEMIHIDLNEGVSIFKRPKE